MKSLVGGTAVLVMALWTTSAGQDLKIGLGGGALFLQGPRAIGPEMYERGGGFTTSFSLGGEVEYSMPTMPISLVGGLSYSPIWNHQRRDSAFASFGPGGHRREDASLFAAGVGGRWTPLRGPVSPYLGLSFVLTHLSGLGSRLDSSLSFVDADAASPRDAREYGRHEGITRFGIGFGVGSEFSLFSMVDLDVGASYTLNSLFEGRRGGSLNSIAFGASVLFKVQ
jgi:hypothetical protein